MTNGGLAEYVNAPSYMCFKLPPGVPPDVGALAEPTAVAVRAFRRGRIACGETVAVIGAGTIGLLSLAVARISGASAVYVVEPARNRRAVAYQLGATEAIDPNDEDPIEFIRRRTSGLGADLVIEAGGNQKTMLMAPQVARKGGRVVFLGQHNEPAPYNFFSLVHNELELIGSFSHVYDEDFRAAVGFLGDGRINAEPLITARIALDDLIEKGLNELLENKTRNLKILVSPRQ
jgi:(R,R)-butanediol dehydrogenase/meso-butanediol dehydrogenase/diacetyl reductase